MNRGGVAGVSWPGGMGFCFFVHEGGATNPEDPAEIEGILHKRGGATGQRGGRENWKTRYCRLVGHTFYYMESASSTEAKGHMNLLGLGVRPADGETGRLLSICLFWPEDSEATFYLQP